MERLNDLVIKKREQEDKDPRNRIISKEKRIQNQIRAIKRMNDKLPFEIEAEMQASFAKSNQGLA